MAHDHSHKGHAHGPAADAAGRGLATAFAVGIALNLAFVAVEFAAGWVLDSVALMSDAGHNLSDVASLALALVAFRLARRKPTRRYTYGLKRGTVVVSLANACLLLVAVGVIIMESIGKLYDPQPVEGGAIACVAGVGIIINGFTAWLFLRHRSRDLNVHGAWLHMAADTLVSVGVLISGLVIKFTGWYAIDPVVGLAVAAVILFSTWGLLRDSLRLSLDGVPAGIDPMDVRQAMLDADSAVSDVHHMHIWALSTTENALTAHLTIDSPGDAARVKREVRRALKARGIDHTTLEVELAGERENENCGDCR